MEEQKIKADIFKSYDIRGIYPSEVNANLAYRIAQSYVQYVKPTGKVAVGHDVRLSSPELHKAVVNGLTDAGIDVFDIGLATTDMYYFAVGFYKLAGGIQVTASHNPAEYNGIKMVREAAYPLYGEAGIEQIRDIILANKDKIQSEKKGEIEKYDIKEDFADYIIKFIDPQLLKPKRVVINPNFGYSGEIVRFVAKRANIPIEFIGLNDKPDGTFPKGRPDPFVPENRPEFVELVKSSGADLGVAWDADGDRVFFCTNGGKFIESYLSNPLFIKYMLKKNPEGKIIYDPRYTWALIDATKENGGTPILSQVGHSYIKAVMRKKDGVFCGESSGHLYFRDFWYADSGQIPFLIILEILSQSENSLEEIMKPIFKKYFISGEINSTIADLSVIYRKLKEKYSDANISELDGLAFEYPKWRANVRPSNTEPLLRLNLEAKSQRLMEQKRDEVLALIRS